MTTPPRCLSRVDRRDFRWPILDIVHLAHEVLRRLAKFTRHASAAHRTELAAHGMFASKSDEYANAVAERYFEMLQLQLVMLHDSVARSEARRAIF